MRKQYKTGISEVIIHGHAVKINNKEKTVCDMFRYRNKLGEDLALEGLKNYVKNSDVNLKELQKYMKICRVKTVIKSYLKGMSDQVAQSVKDMHF